MPDRLGHEMVREAHKAMKHTKLLYTCNLTYSRLCRKRESLLAVKSQKRER